MSPSGYFRPDLHPSTSDDQPPSGDRDDGAGWFMTSPELRVTTSEVRRSADQMDVTAHEASSSRKAMADGISGQNRAWQQASTPGFAKFVQVVEAQAERLSTDLTDLRDKLRNAADVYERQDHEAGSALDSSTDRHD